MSWTYRVSKQTLDNGEVIFAIREFYANKKGDLSSWTEDEMCPCGESVDALQWTLQKMLEACDQEIIDIGLTDNGKRQPC